MDPSGPLQPLLDLTQDKIVVIDSEGTYKYANAATERILGFDPESFVGTNTFEYIHPDDTEAVRTTLERLVGAENKMTETIQFRHRTADDDWVWLESRMRNQSNAELGGYVVSSRDITARREAEKRNQELEDKLQQLAANTQDVLWLISADWDEVLFINEAFEDVWGISRSDLFKEPTRFLEAIHPADRDRVQREMDRLSCGESIDIEYRIKKSDPSLVRWVWVQGQPVFEAGTVARIAGFARDITDRRRRERQLRVLDNLLRHNLRNTMNVILGHADLAKDLGSPAIKEGMDIMIESSAKLLKTVEKERRIVEVLVEPDDPVSIDLTEILSDLVDDFVTLGDTSVRTDFPDEATAVAIPEIRHAIEELLENAVEHATETPVVEIQIETEPDTVVVRILDNAPPIPENEYEPLFAEGTPSDIYHGTGLGFWLVYWIVDISNGHLGFGRTPQDDGNVVTIQLPRECRHVD